MIRTPKPNPEREHREHIAELKRLIALYEAPSELGPRHDKRVRASWDVEAARLRAQLEAAQA